MYAIEEEKLSKPHEHIDLSLNVIKSSVDDGVRRINVAEAMPENPKNDDTKRKNRTTMKIETIQAAKVSLDFLISNEIPLMEK